MQRKKIYTISGTKLAMAYCEGFVQEGDVLCASGEGSRHFAILNRFRSYEKGTRWGRFHCGSALSPDSVLRIYALAADAQDGQAEEQNAYFQDRCVPWNQKLECFTQNGVQFTGHEDILLYDLTGEYLWIWIEIEGARGGSLYNMRLDTQGDNFLWTFPEVYQEEGGFLHRYLSIFSSIYQDMSDRIATLDWYFDLDTAPAPMLMEIAKWLGFTAEGSFLDEGILRRLVRELYQLNRIKGTKEVIRRLIRIVLGEEAAEDDALKNSIRMNRFFIAERNRLEGYIPVGAKDTCQRLYGSTMQDVTILVTHDTDEKLHSQLLYLIRQFKPARSRVRLIFCQKCSSLDSYCFLDFNAALSEKGYAHMDQTGRMSGTAILY